MWGGGGWLVRIRANGTRPFCLLMGSVPSRGFAGSQRPDVRAFFLLSFLLVKPKSSLYFADVFLLLFEHKAVVFF